MNVDCDLHKCKGRVETTLHHLSYLYLHQKDMELTSKNNYEVIKKEHKEVSSGEAPLSSILEKLFQKY